MEVNKDEVLGQVVVTENLTRELFDDIMCTAFDGGVGGSWFWIEDFDMDNTMLDPKPDYFHDGLSRGGTMTIKVNDPWEDEVDTYHLNFEKVIQGFNLYCADRGRTLVWIEENQDAAVADSIVQFALFGKEIYG